MTDETAGQPFKELHRIERHLLASSDRIASIVVEALEATVEGEPDEEPIATDAPGDTRSVSGTE